MLNAALAPAAPHTFRSGDPAEVNAAALDRDLPVVRCGTSARLALHFGQECQCRAITDIPAPDLEHDDSDYASVLREQRFGFEERIVRRWLLLCIRVPTCSTHCTCAIPTWSAALPSLAVGKAERTVGSCPLWRPRHLYWQGTICGHAWQSEDCSMKTMDCSDSESCAFHTMPRASRVQRAVDSGGGYLDLFTTGQRHKPDYSAGFPAKRITTPLQWGADLVLGEESREEIDMVVTWVRDGARIMREWQLAKSDQTRVPQSVLRAAGYGQNTHCHAHRPGGARRCLSHRFVARGFQIHWRNREEPGARL